MKTDDVLKALECQLWIDDSCNCYGCLYREDKSCINAIERIFEVIKDLINHQKAEIERLKWERDSALKSLEVKREEEQREHNSIIKELGTIKSEIPATLSRIKSEAIKEFAERLKGELTTGSGAMRGSVLNIIDSLVKEMTEERDGTAQT